MKQTVNIHDFIKAFQDYGRSGHFTYEGLRALFEFLEEIEEDTGMETELDVIGICCEFTQYANLEAFQGAYGPGYESIEDIQDATLFIPIDDESFIVQDF